jgi:hypothetical protein
MISMHPLVLRITVKTMFYSVQKYNYYYYYYYYYYY